MTSLTNKQLNAIANGNKKRLTILLVDSETLSFSEWNSLLESVFMAEFGIALCDLPDLVLVRDLYDEGATIFDALESAVDTHFNDCSGFAQVVSMHPHFKEFYGASCG